MRQGAPSQNDLMDAEAWMALRDAARQAGVPLADWLREKLASGELHTLVGRAERPPAAAPGAGPAVPPPGSGAPRADHAVGDLQRRVHDLAEEIEKLARRQGEAPVPARAPRETVRETREPREQIRETREPREQIREEGLGAALEALNERIERLLEDPEKGSAAAASHLDETVRRLNERLEAMAQQRLAQARAAIGGGGARATAARAAPEPRFHDAPPAGRSYEGPRTSEIARASEAARAGEAARQSDSRQAAARQSEPRSPEERPRRGASAARTGARAEPPAPTLPDPVRDDLAGLQAQLGRMAEDMREMRQRLPAAQALDALRAELDGMRRALADLAPRRAVEELEHALVLLAERLDPEVAAAPGAPAGEIAEAVAALRAVIEQARPAGDPALAASVERLSRKVDLVNARSVDGATIARLQAQVAEMRELLGHALSTDAVRRLAEQVALLVLKLDEIGPSDARIVRGVVEELEPRFAALGSRVEALDGRLEAAQASGVGAAESLGERLAERLKQSLAADLAANLGVNLEATLEERLTARVSDRVAERLAATPDSNIATRLDEIQSAVAEVARLAPEGMTRLFDGLMERMEQVARPGGPDGALDEINRHIAAIAEKVEASDTRLARLGGIEQALEDLFVQIEETRASTLAAAEERARALSSELTAPSDSGAAALEALEEMRRELAELEARQDGTARRTRDTLEAVHETLERVVDRIASLQPPFPDVDDALARGRPAREAFIEALEAMEAAAAEAGAAMDTEAAEADTPARAGGQAEAGGRQAETFAGPFTGGFDEAAATAGPNPAPAVAAGPSRPARQAAPEVMAFDPAVDDDLPLEPGSGAPVAVAAPRAAARPAPAFAGEDDARTAPSRSSFIAAARRAAQAPQVEVFDEEDEDAVDSPRRASPLVRLLRRAGLIAVLLSGGGALAYGGAKLTDSPMLKALAELRLIWQPDFAPAAEAAIAAPAAATAVPAPAAAAAVPAPAAAAPAAPQAAPGPPPAHVEAGANAGMPGGTAAGADAGHPGSAASVAPADTQAGGKPAAGPAGAPASGTAATPAPVPPAPPAALGNAALRAAALAGEADAAYEVGLRYADGRGVAENPPLAAQWFAFAFAKGSVPAGFRLAALLDKGAPGLPRDATRARALYLTTAEAGNVRAMHNLAVLLGEQGDYAEAAVWFARAAERGVRDSQYNLGVLYGRGLGLARNLPLAYRWFAIAARRGDTEAVQRRDEVASRLDPETVRTQRGAALAWEPADTDRRANVAARKPDWDLAAPPS